MFKRISIFTVLSVLFLFSFFVSSAFADEYDPLSSPENYIKYLESFDEEDALENGIDTEFVQSSLSQTNEVIKDFKELSKEDQELFLEYMRNPEQLIEETFSGEDENLEFIEDENLNTSSSPSLLMTNNNDFSTMSRSRSISHTGTLRALGINWTEYKIVGTYEYNSTRATRHLSTRAFVNRNFNPTVTTQRTSQSGYISDGQYRGRATFSFKVGIRNVGVQIGTVNISVRGGAGGKRAGSFFRS